MNTILSLLGLMKKFLHPNKLIKFVIKKIKAHPKMHLILSIGSHVTVQLITECGYPQAGAKKKSTHRKYENSITWSSLKRGTFKARTFV